MPDSTTLGQSSMINIAFDPHDRVRIGVVGTGSRGSSLLGNLLQLEHAAITAVHDHDPATMASAADRVAAAGQARPVEAATVDGVLDRDDVDLVLIASPWDEHTPQAVRAMEAGKHVAVEVPAALSVEDCWRLVRTSERTRRHCVMLENCCYGYNELLVLNLVRAGRLVHGVRTALGPAHAARLGVPGPEAPRCDLVVLQVLDATWSSGRVAVGYRIGWRSAVTVASCLCTSRHE